MEKQGFQGGCGYTVTEKDQNPSEHYDDIPDGCKLSNGLGIVVLLTLVFTLIGISRDEDSQDKNDEDSSKTSLTNKL
jgi:hypothetical protein